MKLPKIGNQDMLWFGSLGLFLLTILATFSMFSSVSVHALGGVGLSSMPPIRPAYVAFGDSITTGSSVATCKENRVRSPWGCSEMPTAAIPYPDKVAQALQLTYSDNPRDYASASKGQTPVGLYRAGIWGYTAQEAARAQAAGHNQLGAWVPQLTAIKQARQLVTGSLGINDMHFSDVAKWAKLYVKPGDDHVTLAARAVIADRQNDFDQLFSALGSAKEGGAKVIIGLYYNPYDSDRQQCSELKTIGDRIVDTLDNEILDRSHQNGFSVADFRRSFAGHGAGSNDSYVFGKQCSLGDATKDVLPAWLGGGGGKKALGIGFDPHPNNNGTTAMANAILQEYNNAD